MYILPDLLYTILMILVIVRVGSLLPIPGVDTEYFSSLLSGINTGDLSYLNAKRDILSNEPPVKALR